MLEGVNGRQARLGTNTAAVVMNRVQGGTIRGNRAPEGTATFLLVTDPCSRDLVLSGNDLSRAKMPYALGRGVAKNAIAVR